MSTLIAAVFSILVVTLAGIQACSKANSNEFMTRYEITELNGTPVGIRCFEVREKTSGVAHANCVKD